jgi:hypothetical protein
MMGLEEMRAREKKAGEDAILPLFSRGTPGKTT